MSSSQNTRVLPRHRFFFRVLRPVGWLISRIYGYRYQVLPLEKDQNYIILANHQTDLDPVYLALHFPRPLYMVATDNLFNGSPLSRLLSYAIGPIRKEKANPNDMSCIRDIVTTAKEGGSILIFPEGNTAWADYQFYIAPAIAKLVKMTKLPLVLFNLEGGYGTSPRWGRGRRRGPYTGEIREILSVEEIKAMSAEELHHRIVKGLRVIDADSGKRYTSPRRAEYLERLLFLCPSCGGISTLRSDGAFVSCSCGMKAEYTEEMTLRSDDPDFPFRRLADWHDAQRKWARDFVWEDPEEEKVIFEDEGVSLYEKGEEKRTLLSTGRAALTPRTFSVGTVSIPVSEIRLYTVFSSGKLNLSTEHASYYIRGQERFNAVKYLLLLNRLTGKDDLYYGIRSELFR